MISRRMLFACSAGFLAGTDARTETTPGIEKYAVNAPVTDGSRDVTAAFLVALKTHDRVYVPEGMYRIDSRVDLSRLYGPGILTFNTGHEVALKTPADSETLDQMFFADLKYAVEKVGMQDMSVCGGSVFLSQNVRNPGWSEKSVVRVSEYAFPRFTNNRPSFRIETDADQAAPMATAAFLGLGHGQGCQAVREEGRTVIYMTKVPAPDSPAGNGVTRIMWRGSDTRESDFRVTRTPKSDFHQVGLSPDGEYLLGFVQGRITVFKRLKLLAHPGTAKPVLTIPFRDERPRRFVSGLTTDGRFIYVLQSSTADPWMKQRIDVFTREGRHRKTIETDSFLAFLPEAAKEGTERGFFPINKEVEGLSVWRNALLMVCKLNFAIPRDTVARDGRFWIAAHDSKGVPPPNLQYWREAKKAFPTAKPWNPDQNYRGFQGQVTHRFLIGIVPRGFLRSDAPLNIK